VLHKPLLSSNFNHSIATAKAKLSIAIHMSNALHQFTAVQISRRLTCYDKIFHIAKIKKNWQISETIENNL
jgi:hypothetical protein